MIGIGIDTGGTYTDAVIYDFTTRQVLAKGKALTTKQNLELGIAAAMDTLPQDLLEQAAVLSLSTTLATNACVEDKGGRAKLILLGTSRRILNWIDADSRYGLRDEDVLCVESDEIFSGKLSSDPKWFHMVEKEKEFLRDAQALAIAEVPAMRNGAICERYTREQLSKTYHVPFVMANELALDLNVMERGATALLNARLLPIVEEFLRAVDGALQKRNLSLMEMIVRSDGSLMTEQVASTYPIQTILSGPASSVIGARNLADTENCLIVDMGGTTTDISLVNGGRPAMSDRITIGGYKTQIKGVYIETFGLGGDSRITVFDKQKLVLNTRRVQPLCVAAAEHPELVEQLRALVDSCRTHTHPLHECLYVVKDLPNPRDYTPQERRLVEQLKDHPVLLGSGEIDIYNLKTERLEKEGILMRAGLTPTDIMHIRGDFNKYDKEASVLAAKYVMHNLVSFDGTLEEFCEKVYDMVCARMYENILKIQLQITYPEIFGKGIDDQVMAMIHNSWDHPSRDSDFFGFRFHTCASLIGIGAPTHIFLPRVAEKLHTTCVIPEHAEVANAVGAITADISATYRIRISPNYTVAGIDGYTASVPTGDIRFETLEEAIAACSKAAEEKVRTDARSRGALGDLTVEVHADTNKSQSKNTATVELDTFVTASAKGKFYQ